MQAAASSCTAHALRRHITQSRAAGITTPHARYLTPSRAKSHIADSKSCSSTHPEAGPVVHDRSTLYPGQGRRNELLGDWQLMQGVCSLQSLHRLQRAQQHVLVWRTWPAGAQCAIGCWRH